MKLNFVVFKYVKRSRGVEVARRDNYEDALTYIETYFQINPDEVGAEFYIQCIYTQP